MAEPIPTQIVVGTPDGTTAIYDRLTKRWSVVTEKGQPDRLLERVANTVFGEGWETDDYVPDWPYAAAEDLARTFGGEVLTARLRQTTTTARPGVVQ